MIERIQIGPCPVDCLTPGEALAILQEALLTDGRRLRVAPVNASTVAAARDDKALCEALTDMDLLLPDGFWLHVAARLLRLPNPHHAPTVPLVYELLALLARRGGRVFLLGAEWPVVAAAAGNLARRYPGLLIAGAQGGYFTEAEEEGLLGRISECRPDLLLIGISSPRRDLLMARWRGRLAVPVTLGVGGLIDILGGKTPEGPAWLRRFGLMWLYRLLREPRRLWRRYTVTNLAFLRLVLHETLVHTGHRHD